MLLDERVVYMMTMGFKPEMRTGNSVPAKKAKSHIKTVKDAMQTDKRSKMKERLRERARHDEKKKTPMQNKVIHMIF